jgi:hypothetical protein
MQWCIGQCCAQGFLPVGKGQLASGFSVVCAAGSAFTTGVVGTFFDGAGLAVTVFSAVFFAGADLAVVGFLTGTALTAGVEVVAATVVLTVTAFFAGADFSTATFLAGAAVLAFVAGACTGAVFLTGAAAGATLGAGAAFFATVFFAVAIQISLISLQ